MARSKEAQSVRESVLRAQTQGKPHFSVQFRKVGRLHSVGCCAVERNPGEGKIQYLTKENMLHLSL